MPKQSRTTIFIMILLVVMFITGIIIRWDYIAKEVSSSVDHYIHFFNPDSVKSK